MMRTESDLAADLSALTRALRRAAAAMAHALSDDSIAPRAETRTRTGLWIEHAAATAVLAVFILLI